MSQVAMTNEQNTALSNQIELTRSQRMAIGGIFRSLVIREANKLGLWFPTLRARHVNPSHTFVEEIASAISLSANGTVRINDHLIKRIMEVVVAYESYALPKMGYRHANFIPSYTQMEEMQITRRFVIALGYAPIVRL